MEIVVIFPVRRCHYRHSQVAPPLSRLVTDSFKWETCSKGSDVSWRFWNQRAVVVNSITSYSGVHPLLRNRGQKFTAARVRARCADNSTVSLTRWLNSAMTAQKYPRRFHYCTKSPTCTPRMGLGVLQPALDIHFNEIGAKLNSHHSDGRHSLLTR